MSISTRYLLLATIAITRLGYAGECGQVSDPAAVVHAQVEAYNRHDVAAFLECYAANAAVTDLTAAWPTLRGMADLVKAYAFLEHQPPEYGVDVVKEIDNGPVIVLVERLRAQSKVSDGVVVYEVRDGKITNVWFPPKA